MLLLAVTACGTSDVTTGEVKPTPTAEPSPHIVDYSVEKDLTEANANKLRQAWIEYVAGVGSKYELRGDLIYYGTTGDYMVFQAPITSGGITYEFGYRRFESDGPVEMFVYYTGTKKTETFTTLYTAWKLRYIKEVEWVIRQHFLYCEQELNYDYTCEMVHPPEDISEDIHKECSKTVCVELPWNLTKGISYYGEYNGYHVVGVGEKVVSKEKDVFGSFVFPDSDKISFYAYDQNEEVLKLRELTSAYEYGMISDEDIQAIYNIYKEYEIASYRNKVEQNVVSTVLPNVLDYSSDKDLTREKLATIQKEWVKFAAQDDIEYELRGDLVYYGTFNGFMAIQAPLKEGGVGNHAGFGVFESDGPVEIFLYGRMPNGNTDFFRYMYVYLWNTSVMSYDSYNLIEARHFDYCEEYLGFTYTIEEPLPPADIKAEIEVELSKLTSYYNTNNWNLDGDVIYFGEYNGYHVVFASGFKQGYLAVDLFVGKFGDGYNFPMSSEFSTFAYKDGVLYSLDDVFESGEITGEDVEKMIELSYIYNLHVYRNSLKTE